MEYLNTFLQLATLVVVLDLHPETTPTLAIAITIPFGAVLAFSFLSDVIDEIVGPTEDQA